ncbi:hypothetical protein [Rhizobium oryziradicis]|uniref:Uncharacterized protein n=1 Tax=Rhizobium oryziradicis TaxID=1867956 RepID=A0A1Q8ZLN5_9HYPH|nr:hypothetical protein [Rhizobium oryziradicis]OLP42684.1 hypothetical protein BJF95_00690 [Rhizobium oryziradicis]
MNLPHTEADSAKGSYDKTVAEWVYKFLVESGEPAKPVLLSKLGGRIAKEFGKPVRLLLGRGITLSQILSEQLEGKVGFTGTQGTLAVFLDETATSRRDEPLPRLDKVLWTAFFRPIKEGDRRFLRLKPEVYFWDGPEDSAAPSPGWEEIEPHRIPPEELALPQRNRAAYNAIEEWFKLRGYVLQDHVKAENSPQARSNYSPELNLEVAPLVSNTMTSKGIDALRHLVLSIPEKDRKGYSMPLDLLAALLL